MTRPGGWVIALAMVVVWGLPPLRAQPAPSTPSLRGGWAAAAPGNRVFQGTWTAQPVPNDPNSAQGTWTMLSGTRVAAEGTWSATKTARSWSGTWQSRITTAGGRVLSGSWRTQVSATDVRNLGELLQQTLAQQVTGTWASGQFAGSWSLRAYR